MQLCNMLQFLAATIAIDTYWYMQVGLFDDSNLCAIHAKRVTIM